MSNICFCRLQENIKDYKLILRSVRTFDEISIHIWSFAEFSVLRLTEIFNKYREEVRKISFSFTVIEEVLLLRLLNFLPNLEEIIMDVSLSNSVDDCQHKLISLVRVRSVTCKVESAPVIFQLPDDVLTSLSFESSLHDSPPSTKLLAEIFKRQKRIKDLNFDPRNVCLESLEKLTLSKLRSTNVRQIFGILEQQRKLKTLNLIETVNDKELLQICQLKNLRCLVVDLREIKDSNSIKGLSNLHQLEQLSIYFDSSNQWLPIAELCLPKLSKLDLIFSSKLDLQFNRSSILASTNLRHLKFSHCDFNSISSILTNEKLEALELGLLENNSHENLMSNRKIHWNLKLLTIENSNVTSHEEVLRMTVESLPKLQKLSLGNVVRDDKALKMILMSLKSLTHLSISNQIIFNFGNETIKVIKDCGNNLRYLKLVNVKLSSQEGAGIYKKHFEAQFEFYQLEDKKITLSN